jgi:hypothetical protein
LDVATVLDRDVSALSDSKLHNENRELLSSVRVFTETEFPESIRERVLESGTSETAGRSEQVSSEWKNTRVEMKIRSGLWEDFVCGLEELTAEIGGVTC